jgi:hypothetical protein
MLELLRHSEIWMANSVVFEEMNCGWLQPTELAFPLGWIAVALDQGVLETRPCDLRKSGRLDVNFPFDQCSRGMKVECAILMN